MEDWGVSSGERERERMNPAADADFEAFAAANWHRLLRVAFLLTGDWGEAEDLVQSALATCYRHWSRVVAGGAELPYVRKAIVNAHISTVRRRRIRELITFAVPDRAQDSGTGALDDRDLLRRALRRLPPRTRTAVVLRHYSDLSEEETAAVMSCSIGNVKRLTADGLRLLKAYFEATGSIHPMLREGRR